MITRNRVIFLIITCLVLWKIITLNLQEKPSVGAADDDEGTQLVIEPLQVAVFYETLCPDSRSFFIRQLLPAYERAPHLFDISLIPYGKASTQKESGGKLVFRCQHGPLECYGNKIHACSVAHIASPSKRLRYTTCMISDNSEPEQAGSKCARSLDVNWEDILQCARTWEGDELLAKHGELTHNLSPPASFIPTIQVDQRLDEQPALLKDLFTELCARFKEPPLECSSK